MEEGELQADFWIDASGFHRILTQDVPFISFSKYLPVNKSISTGDKFINDVLKGG